MIFNILRTASIIIAFVLSSLTISKGAGLDGGYQGFKGIPIPYRYDWFPTFPSSQNNLIYALDFFFWIIVFNLMINLAAVRKANQAVSFKKILFTKENFYVLIAPLLSFVVSLAFIKTFSI